MTRATKILEALATMDEGFATALQDKGWKPAHTVQHPDITKHFGHIDPKKLMVRKKGGTIYGIELGVSKYHVVHNDKYGSTDIKGLRTQSGSDSHDHERKLFNDDLHHIRVATHGN